MQILWAVVVWAPLAGAFQVPVVPRPRLRLSSAQVAPEEGWRKAVRVVDDAQSRVWSRTKGLPPAAQFLGVTAAYAFHTGALCRHSFRFPVELFPNDRGMFVNLGFDTIAGLLIVLLRGVHLAAARANDSSRRRRRRDVPWRNVPRVPVRHLVKVLGLLLAMYVGSGIVSMIAEELLYLLELFGVLTISEAMHRSIQILVSHFVWIAAGVFTLRRYIPSFWPRDSPFYHEERRRPDPENDKEDPNRRWFRIRFREDWLLWVVGGYYVSWFAFNMADCLSQLVLPAHFFADESVVSRMTNPEDNDIIAMTAGAVAPCVTAPWWEELLYRGFLLPAIAGHCALGRALPLSAILFSIHHWSLAAGLPLAMLGLVWALLYIHSRNLLVTIIIHAMWNTRVFIGALIGF